MPSLVGSEMCIRDRLYEADFHKPGIYGSGRVWANAWDVFRRAPSRGGRGRRVAVDSVVCFGWGFCFRVFLFRFIFSSDAHGLLQVRGHLASFTSLVVGVYIWDVAEVQLTEMRVSRWQLYCCTYVIYTIEKTRSALLPFFARYTWLEKSARNTGCAGCRRVERTA